MSIYTSIINVLQRGEYVYLCFPQLYKDNIDIWVSPIERINDSPAVHGTPVVKRNARIRPRKFCRGPRSNDFQAKQDLGISFPPPTLQSLKTQL